MKKSKGKIILEEFCRCEKPIIATKNGDFGYQEYCTKCSKNIQDGFHYYDEPQN
ncbi:MAG: hypothetical protein ACI4R8_04635 [Candidatus Caccovivens sp.]